MDNESAFAFYSQQPSTSKSKPGKRIRARQSRKLAKKAKINGEPVTKTELKTIKIHQNGTHEKPAKAIVKPSSEVPKKKVKKYTKPKVKKPVAKATTKTISIHHPAGVENGETKPKVKKPVTNKSVAKATTKTISINHPDSVENGRQVFSWLISPVELTKFFRDNWEKQPIYIKRNCTSYFSYLISCEDIDVVIRKRKLLFTKNIDITSYSKGHRETHNPAGRATAPLVWDYYANGCSVRILNPQKYFSKIHALNATLQEYFACLIGANVYLTPAGTQGFAPHYDDIEAFVMQVEGQKLWKLYAPRTPAETLPRFSSGNFSEKELGAPIQEILMSPGDMLYFPRGIIHQAHALEHTHSLHITLSVYQKNSWADLLEQLLPAALKQAIEEDISFREGLPMQYLSHMGVVHSDTASRGRTEFLSKLQSLIARLVKYAPVDAAVDQLGKQFIHDSLPPYLRREETSRIAVGDGERIKDGRVYNQAEMGPDTMVKLIRYNCIRVVNEDDTIRIYYSVNNSREYHAEDPQFLEIDADLAPAVEALIAHYPEYIAVEEFPIEDTAAKVQIASDLWEHGLLMTEEPLGYTSE